MRYYHPTATTYTTYDAPEDKSPLEWRPTLEKGEETHVRDCLTWHSPSPRHTYRNHNYRMYTHDGRDYWTARDCGNPGCRQCRGDDILTARDVGYVRRNELGRTVDRGFSSKPWKLRMQESAGDYGDGSWTQRFDPAPDTARGGAGGGGMRDPFNRPIGDYDKPWSTSRFDPEMHHRGGGGGGCCGSKGNCSGSDCRNCNCKGGSCNGKVGGGGCGGGYRGGAGAGGGLEPYDLNSYRSSFPRIDEKDPGSITYRPLGGTGPASIGYNRPTFDDFDNRPVGGGGASTYRPPPPPQPAQTNFDSGYQGTSPDKMSGFGGNGGFGGGGAGGAAARGNDMPFPRKDDPASSMKPAGPRRELKGPNTAVAFTV